MCVTYNTPSASDLLEFTIQRTSLSNDTCVANVQVEILSLLISLAIMHNPTCDMPTLWVMVRPMDDAAFFIPDILTIKANAIPDLQSGDPRRNVDVVCNQQRLS